MISGIDDSYRRLAGRGIPIKEPLKATNLARKNLGITSNGTIVEITVTKKGVAIPQIENFISMLERYYSLLNKISFLSIFHKHEELDVYMDQETAGRIYYFKGAIK